MLLFIALEAIAISVLMHSNVYHKAKIAGSSNRLVVGVYDKMADVNSYFGLQDENLRLLEENARLRSHLSEYIYVDTLLGRFDSLPVLRHYDYQPARIVNNSITKRENYFTINRGTLDGVEPEMAVLTDDGIIGYVMHCSERYSVGISILNTKEFRTSGRVKGTDFSGSIYWDGITHTEVVLDEIPKYADMEIGDTIETTKYSTIFPPSLPIGTVAGFEMINGMTYKVRVKLFADLAQIRYVYVVSFLEQEERKALEAIVGISDVGGNGEAISKEEGEARR